MDTSLATNEEHLKQYDSVVFSMCESNSCIAIPRKSQTSSLWLKAESRHLWQNNSKNAAFHYIGTDWPNDLHPGNQQKLGLSASCNHIVPLHDSGLHSSPPYNEAWETKVEWMDKNQNATMYLYLTRRNIPIPVVSVQLHQLYHSLILLHSASQAVLYTE